MEMKINKTSVFIGSIHVLIASLIQFYARPYYLNISHYTDLIFIFVFILILFTSGYLSHYLYENRDYISPLFMLLLWVLIGCVVFVMDIGSYPLDQFRGLGYNSEFARTFWVLKYIGSVISAPAPAPAPDYYVSSLWLVGLQVLGAVIERLVTFVRDNFVSDGIK